MYKVYFGLLLLFIGVAKPLPSQNEKKLYDIMIEAGAKLLELDIVRARLDLKEKELIASVAAHEKSIHNRESSLLLPLEKIAESHNLIVPLFISLQKDLENDNKITADKMRAALRGLIAIFDSPEILHSVLPHIPVGYEAAISYDPVLNFVHSIQEIAHNKFFATYCNTKNAKILGEQKLSNEVLLFYSIIRQTITNIFDGVIESANVVNDVISSTNLSVDKKPKPDTANLASAQSMLFKAIMSDSENEVILAVESGADINLVRDGRSPLDFAIDYKRFKAVNVLLENGAIINTNKLSLDDVLRFPRITAIEGVLAARIKGMNLNATGANSIGCAGFNFAPPIFKAIVYNNKKAIEILLDAGANINIVTGFMPNCYAQTPLSYALELEERDEIVEFLMNRGGLLPNDAREAKKILEQAKEKEVLESSINLEHLQPDEMLYQAVINNSVSWVNKAIEKGANSNLVKNGKSIIYLALILKKLRAFEALLKASANVSEEVFEQAITMTDARDNCIRPILQYSKFKPSKDLTVLISDLINKHMFDEAIALLKAGVSFDVNSVAQAAANCRYSGTPLVGVFSELSNHGYNLNNIWIEALNNKQFIIHSDESLIGFIKAGADPNFAIKRGHETWTPLFIAIDKMILSAVKTLINSGAKTNTMANPYPNHTNALMRGPLTPLSFAAATSRGYTGIVEYLTENGAAF